MRVDSGDGSAATAVVGLRADAVRNREQIRCAALSAFRGRGLGTPLEEIAVAAGVSKATIYNRFHGREGLIDAVLEDLVAADLYRAIDRATARAEVAPWAALEEYVRVHRDLQYREPVMLDVILTEYPGSPRFVALCHAAQTATQLLMNAAHDAGVVRADVTVEDFHHATVANALTLRHRPLPARADYDRRTTHFLEALRPPHTAALA